MQRPERELKAFASVALEAGESREVVLTVRRKDLAYWDIRTDSWVVEGGDYVVDVAASSRDIRSSATVTVEGDAVVAAAVARRRRSARSWRTPSSGPSCRRPSPR